MAQAIEVNPLELMRKLPDAFWAKVPTWAERYRCQGLQDTVRTYGPQRTEEAITPKLAEEFPEYMEFWKNVLAPVRHRGIRYEPGDPYRRGGAQEPVNDWVELVIGKARARWSHMPGYAHNGWEYIHTEYMDKWARHSDIYYALNSKNLPHDRVRKIKDECSMEKAMARLWNTLRKVARRKLGIEVDAKTNAELEAKRKAVRITKAKMAAGAHVAKLIDELTTYKTQIANGDITVERVREIFDMTNKLTSLNAALKDAMGIR